MTKANLQVGMMVVTENGVARLVMPTKNDGLVLVSADNKMVDDMLYSMSTEVSPGKLADCVLKIEEYEGYTFPKLEENLEMKLHIFSWDDYDFELDYPVNVTF